MCLCASHVMGRGTLQFWHEVKWDTLVLQEINTVILIRASINFVFPARRQVSSRSSWGMRWEGALQLDQKCAKRT